MSGINNVISFYRLLNVPTLTSQISGKVWRFNRPINSTKVDVTISTPEYIGGAFNKVSVEINVHAPNTLIVVDGKNDSTHPDVQKLQSVTDIITTLLAGYNFTVTGKVLRDADGHWFSNNIIQLEEVNPDTAIDATVKEFTTVDDGFGGVTATESLYWTGKVALVDISEGNQLTTGSGSYRFNQRNEFIVPVVVQKSMVVDTSEGRYTITGITPEGLGLWRLNTIRYDSKRIG